jgi:5-methylcytosine-specific restriction endonuclease McrA
MKTYHRFSAAVLRDRRWPALRLAAKRRDRFRCVVCGAVGRLEVDHVKPVRDAPNLAFDLTNLQTMCASCHARKTRIEVGWQDAVNPARQAWRDLVRDMRNPNTEKGKLRLCLSQ